MMAFVTTMPVYLAHASKRNRFSAVPEKEQLRFADGGAGVGAAGWPARARGNTKGVLMGFANVRAGTRYPPEH